MQAGIVADHHQGVALVAMSLDLEQDAFGAGVIERAQGDGLRGGEGLRDGAPGLLGAAGGGHQRKVRRQAFVGQQPAHQGGVGQPAVGQAALEVAADVAPFGFAVAHEDQSFHRPCIRRAAASQEGAG